ncbi:hypothetical protein IFM61606_08325 [Aspergillus udagawae]|uniref:Uncharacterized protein n=1 Tax=Aspergillus udagawae TaxID=91492 RepID=A0A8H3RV34_9EURO|nr:uncharacterized protein Aud_000677 [Aspergillus udagawae]GFF22188.1 hypothetical protein IFM61606_08325 [Aspergillus udagawae]GFF39050.1 hypothetical protein IFM46972_05756 [Aspergillus udagawae]GFF43722.1 hypothetical protein IFM51744_05576 [Aspergillus udagawae]GFF86309.1 hypothetical protein IFM53868_04768 [Aspergillus udagawae]GFG18437.1 hypothetical protein IFM5058_09031 [Aspergillus udagawae]
MQFHLSTICLAAATLFASHILAAPAPAPVPNPNTNGRPAIYSGPSGHDAGNAVCFKGYFYGAVGCPGRAYKDGTCCISEEIAVKVPEPKAPGYTGDSDAE